MPKVNSEYYEERKKYIIDCTMKVLSKKTLEQVNMRDIIRETGFSQGTVYNYYKNVDEIISTIICQYMREMKAALQICIEQSENFHDCYHKICDGMIALHQQNPQLFEAMLGKILYHDTEQDKQDILFEIYQIGEELNSAVIGLLKNGINDGFVRADLNLYVVIFHLWSGIAQTILFSYHKQKYIESQFHMTRYEYMEQAFHLIICSILK